MTFASVLVICRLIMSTWISHFYSFQCKKHLL